MKLKLIGKGKKVLELSKKFGIEIISNTKSNINYDAALIIDDLCYYNIKGLTYDEIKDIIRTVKKA